MGKKVLIVGGGPAGCAAGATFGMRGDDVTIVDMREDLRIRNGGPGPEQRSINLALSTRGLTALDAIGCGDGARELGVPMHGREVHALDGSTQFQQYGQFGQYLLSVPRSALNELVIDAAEKNGCQVLFGHKCRDLSLDEPSVTVEVGQGTERKLQADLVIGADGAFSRVRAMMMRKEWFNYSQDYIPAAYKELSISAENGKDMRLEALHIWPRHQFMLIALPNLDRSFTCTLFLDRDQFDKITTPAQVREFFQKWFPDALELMPDVDVQFFNNPTPGLVTVKTYPYHYSDKALLIGDAAHAIVPFYGQGCNLALEDVRILSDLLEEHGGILSSVLREFTEKRKQNADTIAKLALDNYSDMASRTASAYFQMRKKIGLALNRIAPKTFVPLYTMISFSNVPYSEAEQSAQRTERAITSLFSTAAVLSVLAAGTAATVAAVKTYQKSTRS
ncbi:hypothetical protein NDN08_003509 [Rhodosorus marinus]|uniref:Kynurenine 3-monooxygenase n=1 Tax=Rhodosorus marinus TaxID=101924 RepID=A0AAV8UWR3_9RHOD|nr:hypothetical protein NDN08_003509 [Rhodosorus marinus]